MLITTTLEIKVGVRAAAHFASKGYPLSSHTDKANRLRYHANQVIVVDVYDLPPGSNVHVEWKCQVCHKTRRTPWKWYLKRKGDKCHSCLLIGTARRSGENHPYWGLTGPEMPNWKGGITPANQVARNKWDYRQWTIAVRKLHGSKCQICASTAQVQTHHLVPFHELLTTQSPLLYATSNGTLMCGTCHKAFHHVHGRHTTPEQFAEFKLERQQ